MSQIAIRLAAMDDLEAINAIYNHYVATSTATFAIQPETAEARLAWFTNRSPRQPVLVAEREGIVVGWASLSTYNKREGYDRSTELSIYLRPEDVGQGIGKLLMAELIRRATEFGYHVMIGGITTDQTASIRLHESFGFRKAGHLREVGFKFGRWLDVAYYQMILI
jgi:phosphinothricin acetyltransferase